MVIYYGGGGGGVKDWFKGKGSKSCIKEQEREFQICAAEKLLMVTILLEKVSFNNNNNVHLLCAHQRPERSHNTY